MDWDRLVDDMLVAPVRRTKCYCSIDGPCDPCVGYEMCECGQYEIDCVCDETD
jgi:hypothetical protein